MEIKNGYLIIVNDEDIIDGVLTIPNEVDRISNNLLFRNLKNLKKLELPENLSYIPYGTFMYCEQLEEVKISNLKSYHDALLKGCKKLKKIFLPEMATEFPSEMVYECISLEEIKIPSNVKIINSMAFDSCTSLKNIELPENIIKIDCLAFSGCLKLKSKLILPKVEVIEDNAFFNCVSLSKIKIGKNIKKIGICAFAGLISLENLIIETSLINFDKIFTFDRDDIIKNNNKLEFIIYNKQIDMNNDLNSQIKNIRRKELNDLIEEWLKENNKKLSGFHKNFIINNIIKNINKDKNYDYRDDFDNLLNKYAAISNVPQIVTIENKIFEEQTNEQIYNNLSSYAANKLICTSANDILQYGNELREYPSYISTKSLNLVLQMNDSTKLITKIKLFLDKISKLDSKKSIIRSIFYKKDGNVLSLNNERINELSIYMESENNQLQNTINEANYLKSLVKLYIDKINEQIENLNNCTLIIENDMLNKSDNNLNNSIINSKVNDLNQTLLVATEEYEKLNNLLAINITLMNKLNNIRFNLLPLLIAVVGLDDEIMKKQKILELVTDISDILGEMLQENNIDNVINIDNILIEQLDDIKKLTK